jgi:hypothetical protein
VTELLVVANETLGGRKLLEAVRARVKATGDAHVRIVVPQNRPRHGTVIYDEAVRDAARVRLDLALGFLRDEGIEASGEVGDPDPFAATIDAVSERRPDEIIISTLPVTSSGWLRRDLVERVADATGLPVQHVVTDVDDEGLAVAVTLVVANQTATGEELLDNLKAKAARDPDHLFIVVVPQTSGDGRAAAEARERLQRLLDILHASDIVSAGTIGDPDPFTATLNALQFFRVDDVVISTLPAERSGWLRADLVERVRRYAACPVEHVVVNIDAVSTKS